MDFLSQYLLANSGTVVPTRYTMWSAIALLFMSTGRKIFIDHAHFVIYPGMYICLVGEPASKKTSAMGAARTMFTTVFPDYPTGVSITSREDITKFMASDQCLRTYTDELAALTEWRPLANFVNEFTNWLSFNPESMIEFLTDVYDVPFYISSTLKRGKEHIIHPFLSILACTVPGKIIQYMKTDIVGGGFSRRILFVYETKLPARDVFPTKSKAAYIAQDWCKEHLLKISTISGPFKWTDEAREFIQKWFQATPLSTDVILSGYYESKDIIVQKVAMALAMAKPEPELLLTKELIEVAIALIESNEDNLPRLTTAAGRNVLAVPQQKLLQALEERGGWAPEVIWHMIASHDLTEPEYGSVKKLLKDTFQIFEGVLNNEGTMQKMICNRAKWEELKKSGEVK
jgi:hypothetical protein